MINALPSETNAPRSRNENTPPYINHLVVPGLLVARTIVMATIDLITSRDLCLAAYLSIPNE